MELLLKQVFLFDATKYFPTVQSVKSDNVSRICSRKVPDKALQTTKLYQITHPIIRKPDIVVLEIDRIDYFKTSKNK